jgi:hypothetical protein
MTRSKPHARCAALFDSSIHRVDPNIYRSVQGIRILVINKEARSKKKKKPTVSRKHIHRLITDKDWHRTGRNMGIIKEADVESKQKQQQLNVNWSWIKNEKSKRTVRRA